MPAKAYERAARALENFKGDVEALHEAGELSTIRGIGKGIATEIATLSQQAVMPRLLELEERIPVGVRDLFRVNGLGAKKIKQLWQADITSLEALCQAGENGDLSELKGFGKKSSYTILENADFALYSIGCLRLDEAEQLALELEIIIQRLAPTATVTRTGGLRRFDEVVRDSEVLLCHSDPQAIRNLLADTLESELAEVRDITLYDDPLCSLICNVGRHYLAIHACTPSAYLTTLLATTDKKYWHKLQEHASNQGLTLELEALYDSKQQKIALEDESALYQALDLAFLPPECRRQRPIGSTLKVAELISLEDIRGLVHNHSNWSDGAHSLEVMAETARAQGFAYLAMADHSRSAVVANGLSIARVEAQAQAIAELNQHYAQQTGEDFRILHGMEVDILKDGSLDYPDELLAQLDYCVVSVHGHFNLSASQQTERIIRAVSHPHADILAHPTGRILLRREEYAVILPEVIQACAEYGTVIELNASPYRLDLAAEWLGYAIEQGCHIAINPDAHSSQGYDVLRYGVMMARKAAVPATRVINTAESARAFLQRLPKRSG